jgi:type IX secretion system PorP/SprF family membrane protein
MVLKTNILIVIGIMLAMHLAKAQDIAFSQFYANPIYLNPALAGSKICPRLTLNYRNQWPGVYKGYVSYSAAWDQHFSSLSGGLGIIATADVAGGGALNTFNGSGIYSFRLQATRNIVINAALEAGYIQYRLNWDKLIFGDQIETSTGEILPSSPTEIPPSRLNIGEVDFSAGFLAGYNERLYLGAALHHITMPDLSFYVGNTNRLDMRITVHAGALFDARQGLQGGELEDLSFSPNVIYMQQGNFHQLNAGMYANFFPFVGGLWFRHNFENPDALIVLLGFQQPKFKIGYSFDFTVSRVSLRSGGAHEVSFAWQFDCPRKEFKYKAIKCPRF